MIPRHSLSGLNRLKAKALENLKVQRPGELGAGQDCDSILTKKIIGGNYYDKAFFVVEENNDWVKKMDDYLKRKRREEKEREEKRGVSFGRSFIYSC